ncbi:hypothetical protein GCM10022243_60980 [Saccharothrix violaceirubra]|uniref:Uncharacterized protein n=1 Tax=Saccharothrix violaceirubra TaxID=413306 RepID=A0A7W7WY27_9PSEU|nr:hypothetical protein [Saccharothrix violaceirubra]MBB4968074.1 hypothetical protein [Saccharothrix violaceirubra]
MSRKIQYRTRRPIAVADRPQGTPLSPAQRLFVDRCRELPQLADPLDVELTVGAAVADLDVDEEFWAGVVAHVASWPSRRNVALLRALAVLLTGRPRDWAVEAAGPVGSTLRVTGAWTCDRSLDAGYLVLLCRYAFSAREHAMVFLIDEVEGGLVRGAFVTRQVEVARERLARQAPLDAIGAEAAHWLLAKSYDRLDRRPDLRVGDDVRSTRLPAKRRIALAFG